MLYKTAPGARPSLSDKHFRSVLVQYKTEQKKNGIALSNAIKPDPISN